MAIGGTWRQLLSPMPCATLRVDRSGPSFLERHPQGDCWLPRLPLGAKADLVIGDDPETGEVEFITLYWKDWESGDTHETRYIWLNSSDGLKKLNRNHLIRDKDGVEIENKSTFVADNIYTASFAWQDSGWRLTIEARSGTEAETREYKINPRVST